MRPDDGTTSGAVAPVPVTTILLARHGESDWNRSRRWQGWADRPLTDKGREQAQALAARLADVALEAVYSSDLRRARETAEAVAGAQGLDVRIDLALREVDVGSWSGLTRDEAAARSPEAFRRWREGDAGWEDGESYEHMSTRVLDAIKRVEHALPGGRALVVSHGGPIRAVHAAALGLDVQAYRRLRPVEPNARLSAVCLDDGRFTELCPGNRIDELLARDQAERQAAATQPPSPAG